MAEPPAVSNPAPTGAEVRDLSRDLGFALCGICAARPSDHGEALRQWLNAAEHGEMAWLAEHVNVREDPRRLLAGARSIIMVADRLPGGNSKVESRTSKEADDAPTGRI